MGRLLCLFAALAVTSFGQSDSTENQGGTFQALKQVAGGYNIGDWDGSTIRTSNGDVLTTVSVNANKLDFLRPPGQSRTDLLVTLYKAGVRRVYFAMEHCLVLNSEGRLGPLPSPTGHFQALNESDTGFDLSTFGGSMLLDSKGNVLATIRPRDGQVQLSFGPRQSLETLYDLSVRSFFTEPERQWMLVRNERGKVILREQSKIPAR